MKRVVISVCIMVFFFLSGFTGIITLLSLLNRKPSSPALTSSATLTPSPTPVVLLPPAATIQGKIVRLKGNVLRIPWDQEATQSATIDGTIVQGDELMADTRGGASVYLHGIGNILIQRDTDIVFGSLLPERLTLLQKSGTVFYQLEQELQVPLSLRAESMLLEVASGSGQIIMDNGLTSVAILSGRARLASVGNDNQTRLWALTKNDTASVNDQTGDVRTTGELLSQEP